MDRIRDLLIAIAIVVILMQVYMILKYYYERYKRVKRCRAKVAELDKSGKVEGVRNNGDIEKLKKLYRRKKLGNRMIELEGVCFVERISYIVNNVHRVDKHLYIGEFEIKIPKFLRLVNGEFCQIKGIFDGSYVYLVEVNKKKILDLEKEYIEAKKAREGERVRVLDKSESLLVTKTNKIVASILSFFFLLVSIVFQFWSLPEAYLVYITIIFIGLVYSYIRSKENLYQIKGSYSKVKQIHYIGKHRVYCKGEFDIKIGSEISALGVRVEGEENSFLLIDHEGFDKRSHIRKSGITRVILLSLMSLIIGVIVSIMFSGLHVTKSKETTIATIVILVVMIILYIVRIIEYLGIINELGRIKSEV